MCPEKIIFLIPSGSMKQSIESFHIISGGTDRISKTGFAVLCNITAAVGGIVTVDCTETVNLDALQTVFNQFFNAPQNVIGKR